MKALKQILITLTLAIGLASCSVGPKPIDYGLDACDYCRMTIVETTHGAEMVTTKGKVYKYDAIECMVQHKREFESDQVKYLMMTDYKNPETLIEVGNGVILHSEAIPSPMGAFLTGFASQDEAQAVIQDKGGKIVQIDELEKTL